MLERLHLRIFPSKRHTHPVYRSDDRPPRFTLRMAEEMDENELWEELKKLCKKD
ncbi:MAG: hypothetical protein PVF58_18595 [Candidatus Methanofastidiosia archaeon]